MPGAPEQLLEGHVSDKGVDKAADIKESTAAHDI